METEKNNKLECPICFDEIKNYVITECNHKICLKCLQTMIKNENKYDCCICRQNIYKIENDIDKIKPEAYFYTKKYNDIEIIILLSNNKELECFFYMNMKHNEYYRSTYERHKQLYEKICTEIDKFMKIVFEQWKIKKNIDEDDIDDEYIIDMNIDYVNEDKTIHIIKERNNDNTFNIYTF